MFYLLASYVVASHRCHHKLYSVRRQHKLKRWCSAEMHQPSATTHWLTAGTLPDTALLMVTFEDILVDHAQKACQITDKQRLLESANRCLSNGSILWPDAFHTHYGRVLYLAYLETTAAVLIESKNCAHAIPIHDTPSTMLVSSLAKPLHHCKGERLCAISPKVSCDGTLRYAASCTMCC